MEVDLEKTVHFCETVRNSTDVHVGVKFLNSPLVVHEAPDFLEWALSMRVQCLALQTAYNYDVGDDGSSARRESTFEGLQASPYWKSILGRTAHRCDEALARHEATINNEGNYITADKEFIETLPLSERSVRLMRTDGVYIIE